MKLCLLCSFNPIIFTKVTFVEYYGVDAMAAIHLTYIPEAGDCDFDEITRLYDD